jgi:putative spermidine/putrescine transport system ATP-binding protein
MNDARIEQIGTPADLYDRPATRFAAGFIGHSNLLEGALAEGADAGSEPILLAAGARIPLPRTAKLAPAARHTLLLRPEALEFVEPSHGFVDGRIDDVVFFGSDTHVQLSLADGSELTARCARTLSPRIGDRVGLTWDPYRTTLLHA